MKGVIEFVLTRVVLLVAFTIGLFVIGIMIAVHYVKFGALPKTT